MHTRATHWRFPKLSPRDGELSAIMLPIRSVRRSKNSVTTGRRGRHNFESEIFFFFAQITVFRDICATNFPGRLFLRHRRELSARRRKLMEGRNSCLTTQWFRPRRSRSTKLALPASGGGHRSCRPVNWVSSGLIEYSAAPRQEIKQEPAGRTIENAVGISYCTLLFPNRASY